MSAVILSLQHITVRTFSESISHAMHPGVSCVIPTANVSFLVKVTINTDSHSHARFAPKTRWCHKCSSPGSILSPISKVVKVKMDRQNEVLPNCLKHSEIKTGCFCVIMHDSSATAATDATYQSWNHKAYHPCILTSYSVSIHYFCIQQTSQSNNQAPLYIWEVRGLKYWTADWIFCMRLPVNILRLSRKCQDIILNQAVITSFYILHNLVYIILLS